MSGPFRGATGMAFGGGGVAIQGAAPAGGVINPDNFVTISDAAATTTSNYPMQLGRVFLEGDIEDYPQVLVDDSPVTTQAHVEQRWPDGSVKHAVMFFHLPSLPSGGTVALTFQNQATGNTTGGLSAATVLASWDFNAVIELVNNGTTRTLSARTMLAAGHSTTLYSGSVATTFIIADHTVTATYDTGFGSALTAFRPIFHATFYPLTSQTQVRYIGENGCKTTEVATTVADTITLKIGQASPSTVYTKATSTSMNYASRWTKTFWKGGTPPVINCDHNLAYLKSTTLFPNWDTDRVMPASTLTSKYATWTAASKDLYGAGQYFKVMSQVGGHIEIGPAPGWVVWWLFTGDYRMKEIAFGHADLGGAYPMHFREAQFGRSRSFQRNSATDAGGKVISNNTRPTLFFQNALNGVGIATDDRITTVGTLTANGWGGDCSHQPDPYCFPYLLTGDFWYLEQMWFWAGWSACYSSPANVYFGARGPAGYYGGLETGGEPRQCAWPIRSRARVAAYTPDRFADEKEHFTTLMEDFIAIAEGVRDLTTPNEGTTLYNWGNAFLANKWVGGVVDPAHSWDGGVTIAPQNQDLIEWANATNPAAAGASGNSADDVTYRCNQAWQQFFAIYALYNAKELGFATDYLLAYVSKFLTDYVADATRTPHWMAMFLRPHRKLPAPGTWFVDWDDIETGYNHHTANGGTNQSDSVAQSTFNNQALDTTHGYSNIALCAAHAAYDETNGPATWTWMNTNARDTAALVRFDSEPKWCLIPRNLP